MCGAYRETTLEFENIVEILKKNAFNGVAFGWLDEGCQRFIRENVKDVYKLRSKPHFYLMAESPDLEELSEEIGEGQSIDDFLSDNAVVYLKQDYELPEDKRFKPKVVEFEVDEGGRFLSSYTKDDGFMWYDIVSFMNKFKEEYALFKGWKVQGEWTMTIPREIPEAVRFYQVRDGNEIFQKKLRNI